MKFYTNDPSQLLYDYWRQAAKDPPAAPYTAASDALRAYHGGYAKFSICHLCETDRE